MLRGNSGPKMTKIFWNTSYHFYEMWNLLYWFTINISVRINNLKYYLEPLIIRLLSRAYELIYMTRLRIF